MINIQSITNGLQQSPDGIWYSEIQESISYPSDGNANCFSIEDGSFWFCHRNRCIGELISAFPPPDGKTVFDIGGGNGFVSLGLSNLGFDAVLVEPSSQGCAQAKQRGVEQIICATTHTAKFKQHALPSVGLFDVLEHIKDDRALLCELKNLIQPGGMIYLTVPAHSILWSDEDVKTGHYRRYSKKQLVQLLEQSGFDIAYSNYIFRFLPLAIALMRALPYRLGITSTKSEDEQLVRDHKLNATTTKWLNRLLKSEVNNIRQLTPMTFGASCLVAAKAW